MLYPKYLQNYELQLKKMVTRILDALKLNSQLTLLLSSFCEALILESIKLLKTRFNLRLLPKHLLRLFNSSFQLFADSKTGNN